jgi:ubiquitin-like-conjugating enzyme ATG3
VPCKRRVKGGDKEFLGDGEEEQIVRDMLAGPGEGEAGGEDDGWLKAGGGQGMSKSAELRMRDVRTVDDDGKLGDKVEEEEEIPDMEDEDDEEAIIRDTAGSGDAEGSVSYIILQLSC